MAINLFEKSKRSTAIDPLDGANLLSHPTLNKGTAFTEDERSRLGLNGLLPPYVQSLDEQAVRAYEAYRRKDDGLEYQSDGLQRRGRRCNRYGHDNWRHL